MSHASGSGATPHRVRSFHGSPRHDSHHRHWHQPGEELWSCCHLQQGQGLGRPGIPNPISGSPHKHVTSLSTPSRKSPHPSNGLDFEAVFGLNELRLCKKSLLHISMYMLWSDPVIINLIAVDILGGASHRCRHCRSLSPIHPKSRSCQSFGFFPEQCMISSSNGMMVGVQWWQMPCIISLESLSLSLASVFVLLPFSNQSIATRVIKSKSKKSIVRLQPSYRGWECSKIRLTVNLDVSIQTCVGKSRVEIPKKSKTKTIPWKNKRKRTLRNAGVLRAQLVHYGISFSFFSTWFW